MKLISELKRRGLIQVAFTYLLVAWGVAQVADLLLENFQVDDRVMQLVLALLGIGFVVSMCLAWVFDLRWDGIYLEKKLMSGAESPRPPAAATENESIAVLPFVNMSSDPEQEYFSDGLSEELLNLLAKIPELRVAARTSAFSYKGKDTKIHDIGRELGVAHVLEGSVRKSGTKVRITAQLICVASGYHLWSETWDRSLDDIFRVQDDIAAAVTAQLKISLLGRMPETEETNPEAYSLFLQSRYLTRQGAEDGYEQAIVLLQRAIAIAPNYAPAWRQLGVIYMTQADHGLRATDEGYRLGEEATEHALAVDPYNALAYTNLGRIAMVRDQNVAMAAKHIQKALSLDPKDATILGAAANVAEALGRCELAISLFEYLVTRDPVQPGVHSNLAASYLVSGLFESAVSSYRTALSLSPSAIGLRANLGLALLAQGEPVLALEEIRQEPHDAFRLIAEAMVFHDLQRPVESDAALEELVRDCSLDWAANIASVLAYKGKIDEAFQWLDKAILCRDPGLSEIPMQPEFVNLRSDSRWDEVLKRIGRSPEQMAAIEFEVILPT